MAPGFEKPSWLRRRSLTTPIVLFMAALTWGAQQKGGAPLDKAEIYERLFQQIAAGKCEQDQHGPVVKASRRLLETAVKLKEVEAPSSGDAEPTARSLAMLWLMARVAWEGQRCAARTPARRPPPAATVARCQAEPLRARRANATARRAPG